jgi:hypothetical protein
MKARGQPIKLPIKLTTLSRLSIVNTAINAKRHTRKDAMKFRFCRKNVDFPQEASIAFASDRQAISSDGKFCKGNVKMTAKLYASCTVDDKIPLGRLVVMTVLTSSPNAIQQEIPKKA